MSKSTSERTPYSRHPRTASNPRASWTVASAAFALVAFGCSSDPQKPPTPPKVDPAGIVVKLSLDSKFQPGVIEQIDVVLDAAAGGPSLKLSDAAGSALTFEGTNYRVEVRGVDTDDDAEVVATIEGNPFAQGATTVSVFIPTPEAIGAEGVPFQARLSAQGAMGTLSAASITTRTGGALTFPKTGRYTVEATLA